MSPKTLRVTAFAFGIFSLALCAYGGFVYMVHVRAMEVATVGDARAQATARETELLVLKKVLEESAEDRAALRELVVTDDRLTEFLELIETTAREQGLQAQTQSIDIDAAGKEPFEQLRVTVAVSGTYAATKRFIELIETLPYEVTFRSTSLNRSETGVWESVITFSVTKARSI